MERIEITVMGRLYDRQLFLQELNKLTPSYIDGGTDAQIIRAFYNLPYKRQSELLTTLKDESYEI